MKLKGKIATILLTLSLALSPSLSFAKDEGRIVGYDSQVKAYIIGDTDSGEVFYEKNSDKAYPIASVSKLMTYLISKEAIDDGIIALDTEFEVSEDAEKLTGPEYSSLGLKEGETSNVKELLEGLMVVSGNDCAVELARLVSGSELEFVKKMNERAKQLGLESQSYYNAHGLQTESGKQNSSSAKDLFKLSQIIIDKYPEVLEYAKTRKIVDKKRGIEKNSTIPLVGEIDGVNGLKTGSTQEAGFCLATSVDMDKLDNKDDFRTVAIVLGSETAEVRNLVMTDLIYYVSKYYDTKEILNSEIPAQTLKLNSASSGYVDLYPTESIEFVIKHGSVPSTKFDLDQTIKAPIKAGEKFGKVKVSYKDKTYDVSLVARNSQDEAKRFTRVMRTLEDSCNFLLECIIAR